jgi:hypothetical protein
MNCPVLTSLFSIVDRHQSGNDAHTAVASGTESMAASGVGCCSDEDRGCIVSGGVNCRLKTALSVLQQRKQLQRNLLRSLHQQNNLGKDIMSGKFDDVPVLHDSYHS